MASQQIPEARIHRLNDHEPAEGRYVLYWMQQAQRPTCNHALEYAVRRANDRGLPVLVAFGLMDGYPEANARHYHFMCQGLADTQQQLAQRGIALVVQHGNPDDVALRLAKDAAMLVTDRGYLRIQRQWRKRVAREAKCAVVEIETDLVVPVETASHKAEFAARTIRPKIHRHLDEFLVELRPTPARHDSTDWCFEGMDLSDVDALIDALDIDHDVPPTPLFTGGPGAAKRTLRRFLDQDMAVYSSRRNQPQTDHVSYMSMYLHFGQISPIEIALAARRSDAPKADVDALIEELIVRRELSHNFVWYVSDYDKFTCLPSWARQTLSAHSADAREYTYTRRQLENAETHDPYWNAAMREMRATGYMHNYMRMYWGKKILEWSSSPQQAYRTTLALNNRYFLDGRDANSFANVGWVFGLHDRPWQQRAVFGQVRYMNAAGLRRKCDPEAYIEKVDRLVAATRDA